MSNEKSKVVTLRTKGNRKKINKEPEMIELKRMIRNGELDPNRTLDHIKRGSGKE